MARSSCSKLRCQKHIFAIATVLLANADGDDEELLGLLLARHALHLEIRSQKFGPRGPYDRKKSKDFFDTIFNDRKRSTKSWLRMSQEAFWHVHDLICNDPVFRSTGQKPQRPASVQLAAFLVHVGSEGGVKTANAVSIAEGTAWLYVRRVSKALRRLRDRYVAWPGMQRRHAIAAEFGEHGFPGCIGLMDGTVIRLRGKPTGNPFAFYCHKKFYAVTIQATCNMHGVFTSYDFGWPGSIQDSRMLRESDLWKNRHRYFQAFEYLLVDKGYPLTIHTIRPFHDHDLTDDAAEANRRKKWNQKLSSVRIGVEHAFGRLKGRFPILRDFPAVDMQHTYRTIEALFILHNILETIADDTEGIDDFDGDDNFPVVPPEDGCNMHPDGTRNENECENGAGSGQTSYASRRGVEYAQGLRRRKLLLRL